MSICSHLMTYMMLCPLQEVFSCTKKGSATLHVDPANTAALALYNSIGFEVDGILEDYYSAGKPAHKLAKQLEQ